MVMLLRQFSPYVAPPAEPSQEGYEVTQRLVTEEVELSGAQDEDELEADFDIFLASKYYRSHVRVKEAWERSALRRNVSYQEMQAPDLIEFINERRASRGQEPLVLTRHLDA